MKICYHYDAASGAYLSLSSEADESPLEPGVYYPPAHATLVPPPEAGPHQVAVFDEGAGTWGLQPDFRGVPLYRTIDGDTARIVTIGQVPTDIEATTEPRPGPEYVWRDQQWRYDADRAAGLFEAAKRDAVAAMNQYIADQRAMAAGTRDPVEIQARVAKRAVAQAVIAGTATEAQTLNLATEAQLRGMGETLEVLAQKIIDKAIALDGVNARLDGLKRAGENVLLAAATQEALDACIERFRVQITAVATDAGAAT